MAARRTLSSLHNHKVAIYGTAGTYPDSPAARDYLSNAAALLPKDSTCLGTFICQGRFIPSISGNGANMRKKCIP